MMFSTGRRRLLLKILAVAVVLTAIQGLIIAAVVVPFSGRLSTATCAIIGGTIGLVFVQLVAPFVVLRLRRWIDR